MAHVEINRELGVNDDLRSNTGRSPSYLQNAPRTFKHHEEHK